MRRAAVALGALLAVLTLRPGLAWADPLALRAPVLGGAADGATRGVAVALGYPDASVAGFLGKHLAVAAEYRLPWDAAGASVAWRGALAGAGRKWGLELVAGGGLLVPTLRPGIAVTAMVALAGRVRTPRFVGTLGLAAPMAVRLSPVVESRLPLLLELWLGFRAGPVWLGVQAAGGASFAVGYTGELTGQASAFVAIPLGG